jgi:hypothetical protein
MLPPQAPPAIVSHVNQPAYDAVRRLSDAQAWLATQQEALPEAPASLDGRDAFLAQLDAYWETPVAHAPGEASIPRRQAFARRLAQVASDEADLLGNDASLSSPAVELARTVARHAGGPLPTRIHARELLVGGVPLAGALLLQDDDEPRFVLLFTSDQGWRSFASLDVLYRDLEWHMRAQLADRMELPGIGAEDLEGVLDKHFLDSRTIDGEVFDVLARRLVARFRERAVAAYELSTTGEELREELHAALDLHGMLDTYAIMRQRDIALAARLEADKLAALPREVREYWREAAASYRDTWQLAARSRTSRPPSLAAFANERLRAELASRNIKLAPEDIHVRLTRHVPDKPVKTIFAGLPTENLSLLELAYRNVAATESLAIVDPAGKPLGAVPAESIRNIVRDLDLPNRYAEHLDAVFGDTSEGRALRASSIAMHRATMRFAAADARAVSYSHPGLHAVPDDAPVERKPFLPGTQETSFKWVKAVLDHPAARDRARVDGEEIVVRQLTYKGSALGEVFMISTRQRGPRSNIILYTPDAPDDLTFHEYRGREELDRQFLRNPLFESYLLDRLPDEFAEIGPNGRRRFKVPRFNGDRTLSWIFSLDSSCANCTELAESFGEREVTGSIFDVAYDEAVALAKRNARRHARSTDAANWKTAFDFVQLATLPNLVLQEVLEGTVESVSRLARASWRFYDHAKAGDSTEAFLAFVDGYTSALNVLPVYTHLPRAAGANVLTFAGSRKLVPTRQALHAPDTIFSPNYLARGIKLPPGTPSSGVFAVEGGHVIRQHGKLYHVRYDRDIAGWRLTRPNDPYGYSPAVERLADGFWHHRRVGLLGGGNLPGRHAYRSVPESPTELLTETELLNPTLARMSMHQRTVVVDSLRKRLSARKFQRTLRHMLAKEPKPGGLSQAELTAWEQAVYAGDSAPRYAPLAPLSPMPSQPGTSVYGVVSTDMWPEYMYAYLPGPATLPPRGATSIAVQRLRLSAYDTLTGIPVTPLPPTTPLSSLPVDLTPWLPRPPASPGATLGSATGGWVRFDMRRLRSASSVSGSRSTVTRPTQSEHFVIDTSPFVLQRVSDKGYILHGGRPVGESVIRFFPQEFTVGRP